MTHLRVLRQPERLETKRELAERIGFSVSWIEKRMSGQDGIPFLRFGRSVRFRPSEVDRWLDRRAA